MGKSTLVLMATVLLCAAMAQADSFGEGLNQFDIDFVAISGATNPASGYGIVDNYYRMGVYEITNDQWDKFLAELGLPLMGDPSHAYDTGSYFPGASVPTTGASWYEAAQFVNWLNTSTGHHVAYKFTGTQGGTGYTLNAWSPGEADGGTNLYRHKDAFYFLPTEDEWVKAAYWNGMTLQPDATKASDTLHQGDGENDTGWNYLDGGYATDLYGPWDVGSGSEELNGTFDMMGNVWEWLESPYDDPDYGTTGYQYRALRGGTWTSPDSELGASFRTFNVTYAEENVLGLRVASRVPEPATLSLLALGGLAMLKRRKK